MSAVGRKQTQRHLNGRSRPLLAQLDRARASNPEVGGSGRLGAKRFKRSLEVETRRKPFGVASHQSPVMRHVYSPAGRLPSANRLRGRCAWSS